MGLSWRNEHLFALKQTLALIDAYAAQALRMAAQNRDKERYRQRVVQNLTRPAHQLGIQLAPQKTSAHDFNYPISQG